MPLLFVYGSLKEGFVNQRVNTGVRQPGRYRTRERLPLYLLGEGQVPCIVLAPGEGHQVVGELYEVGAQDLQRMDRLERLGERDGYERVALEFEPIDARSGTTVRADVYVKSPQRVAPNQARIGPLAEYLPEHAQRFRW